MSEDDVCHRIPGNYTPSDVEQIPEATTDLVISRGRDVRLPRWPANVKSLGLMTLNMVGPVVIEEGIETIKWNFSSTEVPLVRWVFPRSLKLFSSRANETNRPALDLRSVTAPTIVVRGGAVGPLRLPEALEDFSFFRVANDSRLLLVTERDYLSNHADGDVIVLPPYLETLRLSRPTNIEIEAPNTSVRTLVISDPLNTTSDFCQWFPNLEALTLSNIGSLPLKIDSPSLREVTISIDHMRPRVRVACPELETLTVIPSTSLALQGIVIEDIGVASISLVLVGIQNILDCEFISRVDTLIVRNSSAVLPFIENLTELELDTPLVTNGYEVRDIFEYKQAWGQSRRKKRPVTPQDLAR